MKNLTDFQTQTLSIFEQEKNENQNSNNNSNHEDLIYKTHPRDAKSSDGVYRSKIRIVTNPLKPEDSIIKSANYFLKTADSGLLVTSSLSIGDKNCPIFTQFKKMWYQGDDNTKTLAKKVFQKTESYWTIVQIIEDINQPELQGQFRIMKLARDIYEKVADKMNPPVESKRTPYPVLDSIIGLELNLEVQPGPDDPNNPQRKNREISYSLSNFGEAQSIIKVDGTNLFTDDQIELIDEYVSARKDATEGKTDKKKQAGLEKLESLKDQILPLYEIADAYLKEHITFDLTKEKGYTPWNEYVTDFVQKWIEILQAGEDPELISIKSEKKEQVIHETSPEPISIMGETEEDSEDLPF